MRSPVLVDRMVGLMLLYIKRGVSVDRVAYWGILLNLFLYQTAHEEAIHKYTMLDAAIGSVSLPARRTPVPIRTHPYRDLGTGVQGSD